MTTRYKFVRTSKNRYVLVGSTSVSFGSVLKIRKWAKEVGFSVYSKQEWESENNPDTADHPQMSLF